MKFSIGNLIFDTDGKIEVTDDEGAVLAAIGQNGGSGFVQLGDIRLFNDLDGEGKQTIVATFSGIDPTLVVTQP